MSKDDRPTPDDLKIDLAHVREILEKVRSPSHRYRLTQLLEIAAQQFIQLEDVNQSTNQGTTHETRPRTSSRTSH